MSEKIVTFRWTNVGRGLSQAVHASGYGWAIVRIMVDLYGPPDEIEWAD